MKWLKSLRKVETARSFSPLILLIYLIILFHIINSVYISMLSKSAPVCIFYCCYNKVWKTHQLTSGYNPPPACGLQRTTLAFPLTPPPCRSVTSTYENISGLLMNILNWEVQITRQMICWFTDVSSIMYIQEVFGQVAPRDWRHSCNSTFWPLKNTLQSSGTSCIQFSLHNDLWSLRRWLHGFVLGMCNWFQHDILSRSVIFQDAPKPWLLPSPQTNDLTPVHPDFSSSLLRQQQLFY